MKEAHHIHYEIRWKNFRGFQDTGWLTIRPLTVLIGPNDSGKSSVIAPLLLLNQTVLSRDVDTPIVTRGQYLDAGTFKNCIYNHDTKRELFLGLRYHTHPSEGKLKPLGAYPPGCLELTFQAGSEGAPSVLRRYAVYDIYKRLFLTRTRLRSGSYSIKGVPASKLQIPERRALRRSRPVNFLFSPVRDIAQFQTPSSSQHSTPPTSFSDPFSLYLNIISTVFADVRSFLANLSYIGPLRERPHRYYESLGELPRTVGASGERTAQLLQSQSGPARRKVDRWVRAFGLGTGIQLRPLSGTLFEINLLGGARGASRNIADAGFGASQVLPLIAQGVAASIDSLTIAEQPEIHLNPRLQGLLADLFVEMAASRRWIIVETHSEHLLLRLRRLIASGEISTKDVALYFVEKGQSGSTIRPVRIQNNGHIASGDWPAGFFGDSLRESLALAAVQSRNAHPS